MSVFKNLLLKQLQQKSRIYLHEMEEDEAEEKKQYNRRQFLETSAKSGIAVGLLSSSSIFSSCRNQSTLNDNTIKSTVSVLKPKVAIVGAGIAGLNAAHYLKKSNIVTYEVYDMLTRVGGRMHTIQDFLPGLSLDIGGEFIDTDHEEMLALCKEFKVELLNRKTDTFYEGEGREWYVINDKRYTMKQVFDAFKNYLPIIKKDLDSCGENYNSLDFVRLDKMNLDEYVTSIGVSGWLKELLRCAYLSEFGLDLEDNSAMNFIDMLRVNNKNEVEFYGESDEIYSIKGGVVSLINKLSAYVENINLAHQLVEIRTKGEGYSLFFANGKTTYADYIILTIPFTILREVKINVDNIAPQKIKAIKELGYGQNAKLFLGFDERVWRTRHKTIGYLFNDKIHNGWDSTFGQTDNSGPGIYTVFIGGKDAVTMAENKNDVDRFVHKYLPVLDKIYPGMKNKFNDNADIAWWPKSKIIKGSYSAFLPGQWNDVMPYISEPIGNILFAGEHCSSDFQGFMNGGAQTGKEVAMALLKKIKTA